MVIFGGPGRGAVFGRFWAFLGRFLGDPEKSGFGLPYNAVPKIPISFFPHWITHYLVRFSRTQFLFIFLK